MIENSPLPFPFFLLFLLLYSTPPPPYTPSLLAPFTLTHTHTSRTSMDALTPILLNFLEEHARPHVQEKVSEELDETKVDLKKDMPDTIMDYIKSDEGIPMIANLLANLGDDFMEKIRAVTDTTIETASEGMDLLLTNGVMNISKDVLTSNTDGKGSSGFNFDFLKGGKEGMVMTTMAASAPIIKQVSSNMGRKIR